MQNVEEKTVDVDTSGPGAEVQLPEAEKPENEVQTEEVSNETANENNTESNDSVEKPVEQSNVQAEENKEQEPKEKVEEFKKNLSLYIGAYSSFITTFDKVITGAGPFASSNVSHMHQDFSIINNDDHELLLMTQLPMPEWGSGAFYGLDSLREDLIYFLFMGDNWIPAPCKIDKRYKKMGFELLELAEKNARNAGHSNRTIKFIEMHGDTLLLEDQTEDAIAKWQEILDTYPTYPNFARIENKIKEALK